MKAATQRTQRFKRAHRGKQRGAAATARPNVEAKHSPASAGRRNGGANASPERGEKAGSRFGNGGRFNYFDREGILRGQGE